MAGDKFQYSIAMDGDDAIKVIKKVVDAATKLDKAVAESNAKSAAKQQKASEKLAEKSAAAAKRTEQKQQRVTESSSAKAGTRKAVESTEDLGKSTRKATLHTWMLEGALHQVGRMGGFLTGMGLGILEGWGGAFNELLHLGGEFESMILSIQATGKTKAEARQIMEDTIKYTQKLPITELEAAKIARTFANVHIDATKKIGESYAELEKKGKTLKGLADIIGIEEMAKEGPTALSLTGDLLSALGHLGTGYQERATVMIMEMIETGAVRSKKLLAALGGDAAVLRKEMAGAATATDRLVKLQDFLAKRGSLGVSAAAMRTWPGMMSQFRGLTQNLAMQLLQPGKEGGFLSRVTAVGVELYSTLASYLDNANEKGQKFKVTLQDTMDMIATAIEKAGKYIKDLIKSVGDFVGNNPMLVKAAAAMLAIGAAIMAVTGAALTATAALGGAIAFFVMAPEALLAFPIAIMAAVAAVVALLAIFGIGAAATAAWDSDLGGLASTLKGVQLVVEAIQEAIKSWSGGETSIPEEMAQDLENAGLYTKFMEILGYIRQAELAWKSLKIAFSGGDTMNSLRDSWERLGRAIDKIIRAAGIVLNMFTGNAFGKEAMDDASNTGNQLGRTLDNLAKIIADVADSFTKMLDEGSVGDWVDNFADIIAVAHQLWVMIKAVGNAIMAVANTIMAMVDGFLAAIKAAEAFNATVSAIGAFMIKMQLDPTHADQHIKEFRAAGADVGKLGGEAKDYAAKAAGRYAAAMVQNNAVLQAPAEMADEPAYIGKIRDKAKELRAPHGRLKAFYDEWDRPDPYQLERPPMDNTGVPMAPGDKSGASALTANVQLTSNLSIDGKQLASEVVKIIKQEKLVEGRL